MSPRGRRPGGENTREAILAAAGAELAERGYDGTSLRGVARRAGVDPALVHHYFDGKSGLFVEVMQIPTDPAAVVAGVVAAPRGETGAALVRAFLAVWDTPEANARLVALIRSAVTHDEALRMVREFLVREVFGRVVRHVRGDLEGGGQHEGGRGDPGADLAVGLVTSQMVGLAMARYVLRLPGVAGADVDELAARVGPTVQRYLEG